MNLWQSFIEAFSAVSDPRDLEDVASPQYKASAWFAFDDTEGLEPNDFVPLEAKLARYALSVLIFATSQDGIVPSSGSWSYGHSRVCEWEGIECEGDEVTKIALRKST